MPNGQKNSHPDVLYSCGLHPVTLLLPVDPVPSRPVPVPALLFYLLPSSLLLNNDTKQSFHHSVP
jgi:hypothetical protein